MLEKIKSFVRSVRIKDTTEQYISAHFPNGNEFIRRAIENAVEYSTKRIHEPVGYVGFNDNNIYGCIRYYWGYYLGRQFVLIKHIHNASIINHIEKYRELIDHALGIQPGEEVDYYCQYKMEVVNNKNIWVENEFARWDFQKSALASSEGNLLNNDDLITISSVMNMDKRQLILSRKAYVYEKLYGATIEWDENAPFAERCKSIKYKGSIQ